MTSKKQTGLRIDQILYEHFQKLCVIEKLRPGEAVEQLVRLAVETGSVAEVCAKAAQPGRTGQAIDEVLFASRLSRLKATLEYERTQLENGETLGPEDRMSDEIIEETVEIGRRPIGEELIREFEELIREADRLYEKSEKQSAEELFLPRKRSSIPMSPPAISGDNPQEVPGN